jgi:hypothetical protein
MTTIKNPIPSSNLFVTMTLEEIQEHIDFLPKSARSAASMVFMFTLNACHQMVEEAANSQTDEA